MNSLERGVLGPLPIFFEKIDGWVWYLEVFLEKKGVGMSMFSR